MEAYLFPTVDENREKFRWGHLEVETIREYAKKTFGWTNKRTDEIILPVVKRLCEKKSQQSISNYFKITGITSRHELKVSKRVRTALEKMEQGPTDSDALDDDAILEKKKPRKKPAIEKLKEVGEKPKTRRKRKAATEIETATEKTDDMPQPSTSAAANGPAKKVILPDNNAPIPQREKEKQAMERNKLKAIEVLRKMKTGKKKWNPQCIQHNSVYFWLQNSNSQVECIQSKQAFFLSNNHHLSWSSLWKRYVNSDSSIVWKIMMSQVCNLHDTLAELCPKNHDIPMLCKNVKHVNEMHISMFRIKSLLFSFVRLHKLLASD